MPQNIALAVFILGGVLLLLALSSGGFKIFGAEMSGASSRWSRFAAGGVGLALIAAATAEGLGGLRSGFSASAPPATEERTGTLPIAGAAEAPRALAAASGIAPAPTADSASGIASAPRADPVGPSAAPRQPVRFTAPKPISVFCASTGQLCDRTADLTGPFPESLVIQTNGGCSSAIFTIHFLRKADGFTLEEVSTFRTRELGPNESQTVSVDPRAATARISAEGVLGGCNEGHLASWGILVSPG